MLSRKGDFPIGLCLASLWNRGDNLVGHSLDCHPEAGEARRRTSQMQCTLSGKKKVPLAVARFLAVCAARNDTAYGVDATDASACVRELRPENFRKRSVSRGAKQIHRPQQRFGTL